MVKAIDTHYDGHLFRSRLEARWAVFFNSLGICYEYEPEGYDLGELGWYLPDFRLRSDYRYAPMWIEIKAIVPTKNEFDKLAEVLNSSNEDGSFLVGAPGSHSIYRYHKGGFILFGDSCMPPDFKNDPYFHMFFTFDKYMKMEGFDPRQDVSNAILNARSARFEFGQTPSQGVPFA